MIGNNIKELRNKKGLTQKDLANLLFVTPQAVSRWENEESEPSTSTLVQMAQIFEVSVDEILGLTSPKPSPDPAAPQTAEASSPQEEKEPEARKEPEPEREEPQPQKPILALCEKCNRPIYEGNEIARWEQRIVHHSGRTSSTSVVPHLYCTSCNETRIREEKEAAEKKAKHEQALAVETAKKRRVRSFVFGGLSALLILLIGIAMPEQYYLFAIGAVLAFTYVSCLFLYNNFIGEMTLSIMSWSFVKFPGIIFSFSIDGFIFLIAMKILFFLLGILLSITVSLFAIALGAALSFFVYPFALAANIRKPEKDNDSI